MVVILLLGGCYGVAMVLICGCYGCCYGVVMVLLGGCYGVARCCYVVDMWLLWCC